MPAEGQTASGPNGDRAIFQNGQWVPLAAPTTMPVDPSFPFKGPRAGADLNKTVVDTTGQQIENNIKGATAPAAITKANADAQEASLKAAAAAQAAKDAADKKKLSDFITAMGSDEATRNIGQAKEDLGPWVTGWTGNILNSLHATPAVDLHSALQSVGSDLSLDKLQAMRDSAPPGGASGVGRMTQTEFNAFGNSVANLNQSQSEKQLSGNLDAILQHYHRLKAIQAGLNPDDPKVQAAIATLTNPNIGTGGGGTGAGGPGAGGGGMPPSPLDPVPGAGTPGPGTGALTNQGSIVDDPALKGVNAHVNGMIRNGSSAAEIRAYLDTVRPGLSSQVSGIDENVAAHNRFPAFKPSVDVEKKWQPNGPIARALAGAALTPTGTGIINSVDMLSMGTLDNMSSNPAMTRAVMSGLNQTNPKAAIAGQVVGGALGSLASEAAAAKLGLEGVAAVRAADAAYGAGYGAGSDDDGNRLLGALGGGATAVTGGMFGRGLARVGGKVLSGAINPAAKVLSNSGIPLTIGQAVGGAAKTLEDKATSIPFVGGMIQARRNEGMKGTARAAFNDVLDTFGAKPSDLLGEEGIANAQQASSDAYSRALDGRMFTVDPQTAADYATARAAGMQIPQLGDQFGAMLDHRVGTLFNNGQISGNGFQDAIQGLRQARSAVAAKGEVLAPEFGQATNSVEDILRNMVQQQHPDVLPAYDAANEGYKKLSVLESAVRAAKNTNGDFTPAQLGTAADLNTVKFGGAKASSAGERPFFELQRAAQNIQPSKYPDSGTAGRMAVIKLASGLSGLGAGGDALLGSDGSAGDRAAAGGAAGGTLGIGLGLLAASPYSKMAQKALTTLLLHDRPAILDSAGRWVTNRASYGGMFGGSGLPAIQTYLTGP